MTYILDLPRRPDLTPTEEAERWNAYRSFLESTQSQMPTGAAHYVKSEAHLDQRSTKSPHDSWLERLTIDEPSRGQRQEQRSIQITLELLGAYHDGRIRFNYPSVRSYSIMAPSEFEWPPRGVGHGDWLVDEVGLTDDGLVVHHILLSRGAQWRIEAADLTYEWLAL
jgi:hypothetical protein